MKRLLMIAVLLMVALLAVPAAAQDDFALSNTLDWPAHDFTMNYPAEWEGTPTEPEPSVFFVTSLADEATSDLILSLLYFGSADTALLGIEPASTVEYAETLLGEILNQSFEIDASAIERRETNNGEAIPIIGFATTDFDAYVSVLLFPDDPSQAMLLWLSVYEGALDPDAGLDLVVAMAETARVGDVLMVGAATDATNTVLVYGDTARGTITDAEPEVTYSFAGNAGDQVVISMAADDTDQLDTYLQLLNSDGEIVAENDDADDGTLNSEIRHTLTQSGSYTILAGRFDGSGAFVLTLSAAASNRLISGQTVQGEVSSASVTYTYQGVAGETITIDMVADDSEQLDTYLVLYGPDGGLVAENDDRDGNTFNSQIVQTLAEDGEYTIEAMQYRGAGAFSLTVQSDRATSGLPDTTINGDTITAFENTISIGDRVSGSFSPTSNQHILYFEGAAGQTVTVTFIPTSGTAEQYMLDVFDATITDRTTAADGTVTLSATLLENGSYGVYVLSLSPRDANRYTLGID